MKTKISTEIASAAKFVGEERAIELCANAGTASRMKRRFNTI